MASPRGDLVSLRLELNRSTEPISGRLVAADGTDEEFTGWLGLAAAIERLARPEERNQGVSSARV